MFEILEVIYLNSNYVAICRYDDFKSVFEDILLYTPIIYDEDGDIRISHVTYDLFVVFSSTGLYLTYDEEISITGYTSDSCYDFSGAATSISCVTWNVLSSDYYDSDHSVDNPISDRNSKLHDRISELVEDHDIVCLQEVCSSLYELFDYPDYTVISTSRKRDSGECVLIIKGSIKLTYEVRDYSKDYIDTLSDLTRYRIKEYGAIANDLKIQPFYNYDMLKRQSFQGIDVKITEIDGASANLLVRGFHVPNRWYNHSLQNVLTECILFDLCERSIVIGDFNMSTETKAYSLLTEVLDDYHPNFNTVFSLDSEFTGKIDHILVKGIRCTDVGILNDGEYHHLDDDKLSDHLPVFGTYCITDCIDRRFTGRYDDKDVINALEQYFETR